MLLEDIAPLYYKFVVGNFQFKADDFQDKYILVSVYDAGGLKLGSLGVTFDDSGNSVDVADADDSKILDKLRRSGEADAISREFKKMVKSTF